MGRCVQCIQKAVLWNIVMLAILSIDTVFVLYFVVRYCIEKGKLKINHIFCVSLGYVYYGLIPFWCFESGIVFHNGGYQSLLMYYSQISRVNLIKYFILSFLMYVMFILGSRTAKRRFVIQKRKASIRFSEQVLFPVVILLGLAILWLNRKFLFKGYNGIKNAYKGTLSAYVIMLFSIALMNFFAQRRTLHFTRRFFNKWGIAFTLFSVMLLSMGGRLYVLTSIFAILVCYSCYHVNGISIRSFGKIFLGLILAAGLIGVVRQGRAVYVKDVLFNILEEPLYCSFSLLTYLGNNEIDSWFTFSVILFSGLINLVPTIIFPDKIKYIRSVFDLGREISSPLGGMHYFVSFTIDFGIVGSMLMFYVFGRITRVLCQEPELDLKKTIYCLICSYMIFGIYRDPIAISIVKDIIEFSIVIPVMVFCINQILFAYVKKEKRR